MDLESAGIVTGGQPSPTQRRRGQSLPVVRLAVICLVALYVIGFVALNTHSTKVDFVVTSTHVSVIWVILLSLALGAVLVLLAQQLRRRRRKG